MAALFAIPCKSLFHSPSITMGYDNDHHLDKVIFSPKGHAPNSNLSHNMSRDSIC